MQKSLTYHFKWRCLLVSAMLCATCWVSSLQAASLKDIRLGEYENFTRIVFELDKAPATPPEIAANPNELQVIFRDITADLVRKIPIKQSPHVTEVQIWTTGNQLSAVFRVNSPFAHGKIRSIGAPPRLLVDINWQAASPTQTQDVSGAPAAKKGIPPTSLLPIATVPVETGEPEAGMVSPELTPATEPAVSPAADTTVEVAPTTTPPANLPAEITEHAPEVTVLTPPVATPAASVAAFPPGTGKGVATSSRQSNRLQYYLVIGLVVLTIVILLLLVLMLLTKYRWTSDRLLLNLDDHLKEQQAKIETINGRIKEHLKHYEKA